MSRVVITAEPTIDPLHAIRFGSFAADEPPVLLLHGQPGQASIWRHVGEALAARDLYALAVDRPGYGRTARPAAGFAANADAVIEFLDHHGIDQVTVVAHSWAGGVALALAADAPERMHGLVLLAPVGAAESVNALDHLLALPVLGWGAMRAGLRLGAWLLDRDRTRRFLPTGFRDLDPVAAKRMAGSARSASARHSAAVEQRVLVSELPFVRDRIDRISVPTVVVAGTHDLIISSDASANLALTIPGATLTLVDAGHLLPAEVPELVADAVELIRAVADRPDGSPPAEGPLELGLAHL